jgi:hypothetical protein
LQQSGRFGRKRYSAAAAFESRDGQIEAALDPILFEHRDMMYANSLELPLAL